MIWGRAGRRLADPGRQAQVDTGLRHNPAQCEHAGGDGKQRQGPRELPIGVLLLMAPNHVIRGALGMASACDRDDQQDGSNSGEADRDHSQHVIGCDHTKIIRAARWIADG